MAPRQKLDPCHTDTRDTMAFEKRIHARVNREKRDIHTWESPCRTHGGRNNKESLALGLGVLKVLQKDNVRHLRHICLILQVYVQLA